MVRLVIILCFLQVYVNTYSNSLNDHLFSKDFISSRMIKVTKWQMDNPKYDFKYWANGVLYAGMYAAWEATKSDYIYNTIIKKGEGEGWRPRARWYHADDIVICQTYLDLYRIEKCQEMIRPTIDTIAKLIELPFPQDKEYEVIKWWWSDALFMAPPVFVKLANITGDSTYLKYNDIFFRESYDLLYNKEEKLFARDLNFLVETKGRREKNGKPIFWSRGNGWVMAGLAKILEELPEDYVERPFYENLFKEMAEKIITLQQPDGLWSPGLLDPHSYPVKETSGTGLFCYALAWGINNNLLDTSIYLPAVKKAWRALNSAVNVEGRVGWVQQIGASPSNKITEESWEVYGTGIYLLAGSEMIYLTDYFINI